MAGSSRSPRTPLVAGLLLAVLVAPGAAAYWGQVGGDPHRSGVAELPEGPLDVVTSFQLFEPSASIATISLGMTDTRHGPTGLLVGTSSSSALEALSTCTLVRVSDPIAGVVEALSSFPCANGGKMLGYEPSRDLLFISVEDTVPDNVLRFVDARDGRELRAVGPDVEVPPTPGFGDSGDWWVDDLVVAPDEGLLYVPFGSDAGPHSIEAIELDTGRSRWQTTLTLGDAIFGGALREGLRKPDYPGTSTLSLARSETGLAALVTFTPPGLGRDQLLAGLDPTGEVVSTWDGLGYAAADLPDGSEAPFRGALRATSQGARVAAHSADHLVYLDPSVPGAEVVRLGTEASLSTAFFPSPIWVGDHVVVPTSGGTYIHGPNGGTLTRWPGHQGAGVLEVLGLPTGHVLALLAQGAGETTRNELALVDLDDARTVHVLPLPRLGTDARLLPLTDPPGLLAWDGSSGRAVLLGPAEDSLVPAVSLSTRYPAIDEPVTLTVDGQAPTRLLVAWGDGAIDPLAPGESASRAYAAPGLRTVRVTAVHEDDRTATREVAVYVGQEPPPERNAIETAFARENQDLTFGLLGIALAVTGGLLAVGRTRRRRGILQRELDAIGQTYEHHRGNPGACEVALDERRAHVGAHLAEGRLDEAQVALLERRIDELSRQVRLSVLDERFQFLPHGMVLALRDMLGDGRISSWERQHVLEVLERDEVLTDAQKGRVRTLLDDWFVHDERA